MNVAFHVCRSVFASRRATSNLAGFSVGGLLARVTSTIFAGDVQTQDSHLTCPTRNLTW